LKESNLILKKKQRALDTFIKKNLLMTFQFFCDKIIQVFLKSGFTLKKVFNPHHNHKKFQV
jgi:hypothetical protein